jgi:hypothetical protein
MADPVLAAYYQTRHILEALRVGEPMHLAIGMAMEASVRLARGSKKLSAAFGLHKRAEEIALTAGDPNAVGLIHLIRAYMDYLLGRIPETIMHSRRALTFLSEHCAGVDWERTSCYAVLFWSLGWGGEVKQAREELPQLLRDEAARGDAISLRLLAVVQLPYLSLDRPDECINEVEMALESPTQMKFDMRRFGAVLTLVDSYSYRGEYKRARDYLMANWQKMTDSLFSRILPTILFVNLIIRGRTALACWLDSPGDLIMRAEVEEYAKRLRRVGSPWSRPMSKVLRAGLAVGGGRRSDGARLLEEASGEFEKASLLAFAASARHFSGLMTGGERGRELMQSAAVFMKAQGVVNPDAFMRALLPGKWIQTESQNQA